MKKIFRKMFAVVFLALFMRGCVLEPVRVSDDAMAPNLWDGDVVLVSKLSYGLRVPGSGAVVTDWQKIEKGDLVLVADVGDPPMTGIRRVNSLPGEIVDVPAVEGGGKRRLKRDEYIVVMDQMPKEPGAANSTRALAFRRNILGKAWRIWIPADSKVESGKPRKFFQRL